MLTACTLLIAVSGNECLGEEFHNALSLQGFTGILNTPNAALTKEGHLYALYSDQKENGLRPQLRSEDSYMFSIGLFDLLEVGGRFTEGPYHYKPTGIRDLSGNFKLQVPFIPKGEYIPQLAVGVQDLGGNLHFLRTVYGVVTEDLWRFRISAGYGNGPDRMKGGFGGVEVKTFDWLYLLAEYDTREANVGLRLVTPEMFGIPINLQVTVKSALNDKQGSPEYGFGFQMPLGRNAVRADMVLFAGMGSFDAFNPDVLEVGQTLTVPVPTPQNPGPAFKIIPDSELVNGPYSALFDMEEFVQKQGGFLSTYKEQVGEESLSGVQILQQIALDYSVNPRLLLALLEYKSGALSQPVMPDKAYPLDYPQPVYEHASYLVYTQLYWAANTLNNGYYAWRAGALSEFDLADGTLFRPDPWQNAATVSLEYFFSQTDTGDSYNTAIGANGFAKTYAALFGDPWAKILALIPGSLRQARLTLPFPPAQIWTYTGGPHPGWGVGDPLAAVDFAPPSEHHGCFSVDPPNFVTAVADGVIARSSPEGIALDLDGDGDERTGWVIFYLHLSVDSRMPAGKEMHVGDMMGYPSCQGGELVTGTHVHIARKYNGEWIPADSAVPFNLEGWIVHAGHAAYQGTMTRNGITVTGCTCSDLYSQVRSDYAP